MRRLCETDDYFTCDIINVYLLFYFNWTVATFTKIVAHLILMAMLFSAEFCVEIAVGN